MSHAFHSARMDPVLAGLGEVAAGLEHRAPRVPWAGALTGELVTDPDGSYWVRQAREAVRYADAVTALAAQGVAVFVEVGPDGTLSALAIGAWPRRGVRPGAAAGPARRAGAAGALARAHVHGVAVDWAAVLPAGPAGGPADVRVPAPAVLAAAGRGGGRTCGGAGLAAAGHPLLGAAVELAGGDGYVLTGRLSVAAQPWLADHVVAGAVLVPGTALVELAVRAGDAAGCGRVEELVLEAPLILPARGSGAGPGRRGRPG